MLVSQAEGDVSKLTRPWVIYSMCHQARDGDKGSEGRNQADILWYMFIRLCLLYSCSFLEYLLLTIVFNFSSVRRYIAL